MRLPRVAATCVLTSAWSWKTCTIVAVERTSTRWPSSFHGTEYNVLPTLTWQSGPTFAVDQVARVNRVGGNGIRASLSAAANTLNGIAPSRPWCDRVPATCRHQVIAADCISATEANSRPRQNESLIYGTCRSTRGLSFGLRARAGSISVP